MRRKKKKKKSFWISPSFFLPLIASFESETRKICFPPRKFNWRTREEFSNKQIKSYLEIWWSLRLGWTSQYRRRTKLASIFSHLLGNNRQENGNISVFRSCSFNWLLWDEKNEICSPLHRSRKNENTVFPNREIKANSNIWWYEASNCWSSKRGIKP